MKKSVLGYNKEQTDRLIDSLQNQNDELTAKVAKLTMELASGELGAAATPETDEVVKELNLRIEALETEKNELAASLEVLRDENAQLTYKIQSLENSLLHPAQTVEVDSAETETPGEICARAYADMQNMKSEIAEEIRGKVGACSEVITESNAKMREAVLKTQESYSALINSFAQQLDDIFGQLSVIEEGNKNICETLADPSEIADEMLQKIDAVFVEPEVLEEPVEPTPVDRLKEKYFSKNLDPQKSEKSTAATAEKAIEDTVAQGPRIVPVERKEEKTASVSQAPIITVHTNIAKDDIFYGNTREVK